MPTKDSQTSRTVIITLQNILGAKWHWQSHGMLHDLSLRTYLICGTVCARDM